MERLLDLREDAPPVRRALESHLASWPAGAACVVALDRSGYQVRAGDDVGFAWASVTKLLTATAVLSLARQGLVDLDEPAGPDGSSVRHLLAHTSGLAFDGPPDGAGDLTGAVRAAPGTRRIYSNLGYEVLARHVERGQGRRFADLLDEHVLRPLVMTWCRLDGSPAHGLRGPAGDLAAFARELLDPVVLPDGVVEALRTVAFPGLGGQLPGFGRQEPNDWGLGAEVRGTKAPHWTSERCSPATFGHFGQSGAFLWVDPDAGVACVAASRAGFGPWAARAWPALSDEVVEALGAGRVSVTGRRVPVRGPLARLRAR